MPLLDISIFKWKCTFYISRDKKWIEGELQLNEEHISIVQKDNNGKANAKIVKFYKMTKITKEKSSYIYPCVVVYTLKDMVWISSLANRDDTFNKIEHFWRQSLLDTRANSRYTSYFTFTCVRF